jgi:hypothetical protein
VGGAGKLATIKDVSQIADYKAEGANGLSAKQINLWLNPNWFRQESQLPFGKVVAYFDGKIGLMMQGQGRIPLVGPQLKQIQGEAFRCWTSLLLSDQNPERVVSFLAPNMVEISDKAGNRVRVRTNEEGLPEKLTYMMPPLQGAPATINESFSNWKEVDGIKFPFRIDIDQDGKRSAVLTVQEYKLNSGLTPDDIDKRP